MSIYYLRNAHTPEEKDMHEIIVMVGFLALVLGAITGFMIMKTVGAIIGGLVGCAAGSFIVQRILSRGIGNGAREVKFRRSAEGIKW